MKIIELTDVERFHLQETLEMARMYGQKVKLAVQGDGIIVKRGGGTWSPPLGYTVDGNGDRVVETPYSPVIERITIIDPDYIEPLGG